MSVQGIAHLMAVVLSVGSAYSVALPNQVNFMSLSAWGLPQASGDDTMSLNPLSNKGLLAASMRAAQDRAMNGVMALYDMRAKELAPDDPILGQNLAWAEGMERAVIIQENAKKVAVFFGAKSSSNFEEVQGKILGLGFGGAAVTPEQRHEQFAAYGRMMAQIEKEDIRRAAKGN